HRDRRHAVLHLRRRGARAAAVRRGGVGDEQLRLGLRAVRDPAARRRDPPRGPRVGEDAMSAEAVVLVHGLWTNRAGMLYLASALARRGYRTRSVGYLSAMRSLDDNAARIAREIAGLDASRVHVVGHSYGGVVSLRALERRPDAPVKRVVLLGSPIGGCDAARQFARSRWKARLLGTTQTVWRE